MEIRNMGINMITNDGDMIVEGVVNKPNEWSETLVSRGKRFRETIAKGVFAEAISRAKEITLLLDHDESKILATTLNGSLSIEETDNGVEIMADIVDTSYGRDAYALIKSNIMGHMSFGFKCTKDSWKRGQDGILERTIEAMDIFEVSALRNPAYAQSTISARGIDLVDDFEIPSELMDSTIKYEFRELEKEVGSIELRKASEENMELFFYGTIGNSEIDKWFLGDETMIPTDIKNIFDDLKKAKQVTIHMNSGGGAVFGGYAIHNLIKSLPGHTVGVIDGLAGSISSVIVFACDEVIVYNNSVYMMHKPSCGCQGNADDFRKTIEMLDVVQEGIVNVYMTKAKEGVTREEIEAMVNKETYLSASEMIKYFDVTYEDKITEEEKKEEERSRQGFEAQQHIVDEIRKSFQVKDHEEPEVHNEEPTNEDPNFFALSDEQIAELIKDLQDL